MKWVTLALAALFEISWAIAMKYSEGFSVLVPSVITAVGYIASAVFLSMALKELPLGTAYAMWTGAGIVGTTEERKRRPEREAGTFVDAVLCSMAGASSVFRFVALVNHVRLIPVALDQLQSLPGAAQFVARWQERRQK